MSTRDENARREKIIRDNNRPGSGDWRKKSGAEWREIVFWAHYIVPGLLLLLIWLWGW